MNKAFLTSLFEEAVRVSKPKYCLPTHFSSFSPADRVCILGAGKAAADMAVEAYKYFGDNAYGMVVTRYGYESKEPTGRIEVRLAAHPVPDENSVEGAKALLEMAARVSSSDKVIFLISGGGSALACAPPMGVTLDEKLALHKFLLRSGASIEEVNTVRKHVSLIKGGRLAAASKGNNTSLVISDVVGDDPAFIASGLTVEDHTTPDDAMSILDKYGFDTNATVVQYLRHAPPLPSVTGSYKLVANANHAIDAAVKKATEAGWVTEVISYTETGEAQAVAKRHAALALEYKKQGKRVLLVSGGELTVTLGNTKGDGGPNQEYLMALAHALSQAPGVSALAADTDGVDGSRDVAGGFIDDTTLKRASAVGLNVKAMLTAHNSFSFFNQLHDHVIIGPTRTNVNDFRVICIE
ncbi:glycerate kinase [Aestuariibacter sp. A3R04]|uniref:glycerate kinase type-2 family protein n=1 Tax=Aestuariibacter sp. A3R04 TaxID=2841571 RepID=UPI001C0A17B5|nr:glycerate kinase [Aestuariibacter sp. A3R04]MBU3020946.1 glycerate kinase [Aestuariibacter sp. A3R04]